MKKINNYLLSALNFEMLWCFMPLMLFLLYIPQALVGIFIFRDGPAFELAGVILLGLFTYFAIYFLLLKSSIYKYLNQADSAWGIFNCVIIAISVCYFVVIFYAVSTSEKVALWESLSGASALDIAYAREALFKSRVGWESLLAYVNAIFSSALMPFSLVICYLEKKPYRHVLLLLFVLSLLPSMEKALIMKALLPLIVLGFNGYFPRRQIVLFSMVAVVVIVGAFFFSKMGQINSESVALNDIKNLQAQKIMLSEVAKSGQITLSELMTQRMLAENKVDNPKYVPKDVQVLLNEQKNFSDMRALGRKYVEDFRMQLKSYEIDASSHNEEMKKALNKNIEFYLLEQPRQISIMEKMIEDNLKKHDNNGGTSLEAQIKFYQLEQPRQISVTEKGIQESLNANFVLLERLKKYNIFGQGQINYAINRILWIPYVTAYDWLGFFHERLSGEYLSGRTSGLIAFITGRPSFPMESLVFNYQFGGLALTTAAANANFLVDAFVNFGWIGVMVYAGFFAVITLIVVKQGNPAMQACYYYFALQASMGGLSGVLFSNGMILLICMAFFMRPKLGLVMH